MHSFRKKFFVHAQYLHNHKHVNKAAGRLFHTDSSEVFHNRESQRTDV
jgi:hypothetical protein